MPAENSDCTTPKDGQGPPQGHRKIWASPFWMTLLSSALLWLSFPPVGLSWLAWIAPAPLLTLVIGKKDEGWHQCCPLRKVWIASFIFWLATFYFIPFPHPILFIGWFALSAYLAIYTPLFLVATRTMVWRWRVPPWVAIPIAWTGLEWIRINFLTGFGMVALSHSQYPNPLVIQIADLSGAYTVTFAMTAFAAGVACCLYSNRRVKGCIACVAVAGLVLGYGTVCLNQVSEQSQGETETVALIQTSIDTVLAEKTETQVLNELSHLREISWAARQSNDSIDLVIWPESSYPYGHYVSENENDESVLISRSNMKQMWAELTNGAGQFPPVPTIVGTSTIDIEKQQVFNSAILLDNTGQTKVRYDKNHRVMFGEYVPLLEYFPAVLKYLPIGRTLTPGDSAELLESGRLKIAANVCFESTVPHLIRRQLNSISTDQTEPNVLINITNDGWFYGTSCLDLHYACNVFRAVELRKPMLVCANTGFSGHIDPWGFARQKGQRRAAEFLICEIDPTEKLPSSIYRTIGDTIPMLMGLVSVVALIAGRSTWTRRSATSNSDAVQ